MLNNKRLNVLRKVMAKGLEDEKAILQITNEQLLEMSASIAEAKDIVALQKAIKSNQLLAYLSGKEFG